MALNDKTFRFGVSLSHLFGYQASAVSRTLPVLSSCCSSDHADTLSWTLAIYTLVILYIYALAIYEKEATVI